MLALCCIFRPALLASPSDPIQVINIKEKKAGLQMFAARLVIFSNTRQTRWL
jgi:hypothetical protein